MTDRAELLLSHAPVFQGAGVDVLRPLAAASTFRGLTRGEHLFRAGDTLGDVFLVSAGSVRVYRMARGGTRELTVSVEGAWQLVAGEGAFQSRALASTSAVALQSPTEVLCVPAAVVREQVYGTPVLARAVIAYFARRQAELLGRMERLLFSELGERLAAHLLEHADRPYALPTNTELAALLGTVPELVSRKLGEFYRLGLIDLDRRTVRVVDPLELGRLAGSDRSP